MFDNAVFEKWLDDNAAKAMEKIISGQALKSEETIILVLKGQANHIAHLDEDLKGEMQTLRKDMDKRFEQVDKRFEQVDKRFEQVDKRFEQLTGRIDNFMKWSLTTMITCSAVIIAVLKFTT